jgi:membrane-associated phospholipid phosphatase
MVPLLFVLPQLVLSVSPSPYGEDRPRAVGPDGAEVPVVAPRLLPKFAPVLAPELAADAGFAPDGSQLPVTASETLSVYNVNVPTEAAITAGALGLYVMVDVLIKPTLQGQTSCAQNPGYVCNINDLNALDRYAVGRHSVPWATFTDVALGASIILPALYLGLESLVLPTREPWRDFLGDMLVLSEALALSAAADTVFKFAFRRPRPDRYLSSETPTTFDDELSLPSGHAEMVAAATTALTTTVFFRHPDSKVRYVFLASGIVLSLATAWGRVESGKHFPTDVITGLLIGGTSGFLLPYLHRKESRLRPSVSYNPSTGSTTFALGGAF